MDSVEVLFTFVKAHIFKRMLLTLQISYVCQYATKSVYTDKCVKDTQKIKYAAIGSTSRNL